jgi:hypothetical protein
MGEWKYSSTIPELDTRLEMDGQLHALATLLLGNNPRSLLDSGLCGPQSLSGRYGEEKNPLSLTGIQLRFLGCPASSLDAIPTELAGSEGHLLHLHKDYI